MKSGEFSVTIIDEDPDWDEFVRLIETCADIEFIEIKTIEGKGRRAYVVSIREGS